MHAQLQKRKYEMMNIENHFNFYNSPFLNSFVKLTIILYNPIIKELKEIKKLDSDSHNHIMGNERQGTLTSKMN